MKAQVYRSRLTCRVCDSTELAALLSLRDQALPNFGGEEIKTPLNVVRCASCGLVQMRESVNTLYLYTNGYGYLSSLNKTMREHLTGLAERLEKDADLGQGDIALDIGQNDGLFLSQYKTLGILKVGFEPISSIANLALDKSIYTFTNFFDPLLYTATFNRRAQIVTAIAMLYDLEDPFKFLVGIEDILDQNGVLFMQFNDLLSMVENTAYDFIGSEHQCFYTLTILDNVLAKAGLRAYRSEYSPINGGSLMIWADRDNRNVELSVYAQKDREKVLTDDMLQKFVLAVNDSTRKLHEWVEKEVSNGGKVYILGASTRGMTILNAAELDSKLISGAAEINKAKIGLTIPGTGIPIVSEEEARRTATAFLVMPYSFKESFIQREQEFLRRRGKLVFPLPEFTVLEG